MACGYVDPRASEEAVAVEARRIASLVAGVLLVTVGLGIGGVGAAATTAHVVGRDADGYVTTPTFDLATDGYALTAEHLELVTEPGDWVGWVRRLELRLTVTPREGGGPVFVGVAPRQDVEAYLEGVAHAEVSQLDRSGSSTTSVPGGEVLAPPGTQPFWAASAAGPGTQAASWDAEAGAWSVVVANVDASPGLAVTVSAGVRTAALLPIGLGLLVAALALVGGGTLMIVAGTRREGEISATSALPSAAPWPLEATFTPIRVLGHLDPELSRWRWLVKWLLLVPHLVVLALLWVAFVALTVAAGVAILVTGRYPRAIFDVNVGVLRWTWRVTFYGYGVLGTDRYPPFTLDDADHPAHLHVAYPERLSRPLVLVKWLLALPHLLVVGLLTGGGVAWVSTAGEQVRTPAVATGLIGVLVLVAGVVLTVTRRYPAGLFDLLVGLNRWVLRVVAYVALMTDQYPPFRLDLGGDEPVPPPPPPPSAGTGAPSTHHPAPVLTG